MLHYLNTLFPVRYTVMGLCGFGLLLSVFSLAVFGEVGVAVVIARPGARVAPDNILSELKKVLANFKIPKRCYVVAELPRNTMGKVQKNLLRAQYQKP